MTEESETFFITSEEAGQRLDKVLTQRLHEAGSRTYFQYLIEEHKVLLNGSPVKKRVIVKEGDEIEVEYILTPELTLTPEQIPLDIIYEDQELLVVNKPAGMVVHPAPGHWNGTFVNALLFHCKTLEPIADSNRPGIVHRIDKDTSGLLLAAKTLQAQQKMIEAFANRQVYKEYLAICVGNPGNGTIQAPIGRHPTHRKCMAVLPEGGRPAITHFRTLKFDGKLSVVSVEIETGRTHQIRVHMKSRGTPVLGDNTYGTPSQNEKYHADRQLLHAQKLRFAHPIHGNQLEFEAPLPKDIEKFVQTIGAK